MDGSLIGRTYVDTAAVASTTRAGDKSGGEECGSGSMWMVVLCCEAPLGRTGGVVVK